MSEPRHPQVIAGALRECVDSPTYVADWQRARLRQLLDELDAALTIEQMERSIVHQRIKEASALLDGEGGKA